MRQIERGRTLNTLLDLYFRLPKTHQHGTTSKVHKIKHIKPSVLLLTESRRLWKPELEQRPEVSGTRDQAFQDLWFLEVSWASAHQGSVGIVTLGNSKHGRHDTELYTCVPDWNSHLSLLCKLTRLFARKPGFISPAGFLSLLHLYRFFPCSPEKSAYPVIEPIFADDKRIINGQLHTGRTQSKLGIRAPVPGPLLSPP